MTEEEFDIQKEIEKYFTESTGFGRDKIRNFMDIVNKALKQKGEQIKELGERCNQLLKDKGNLIDELTKKADTNHSLVEQMADLESENAELKKWKEDTIKARGNDYMAWSRQNDQLAQAKKLLADVYKIAMEDWNAPKWHDQILKDAREYLMEIEK